MTVYYIVKIGDPSWFWTDGYGWSGWREDAAQYPTAQAAESARVKARLGETTIRVFKGVIK